MSPLPSPSSNRDGGSPHVVALAGGIGAGRLLRGLIRVIPPETLTVVVNTADDIERHGLWVSPDIDSVLYALADVHDQERGWGRRGETWRCWETLGQLGEDTWFQLGDLDLATHIWRTAKRRAGVSLSAVCGEQAAALGVHCAVLPMSDQTVTTRIGTEDFGELHLQEWLIRERCAPPILSVRYAGIERARPAPAVVEAVAAADVLIICPSNPVISIGPILAVSGMREALRAVPRGVAITPIIAGEAVKGPAAALLRSGGVEVSAAGVAGLYADLCDTFLLDSRDVALADAVTTLGMRPVITDTVMRDLEGSVALAQAVWDSVR